MTVAKESKQVVVIGAGLRGMSAAIMLASSGYQVTILEKNTHVGGKLNRLQTGASASTSVRRSLRCHESTVLSSKATANGSRTT